MAEKKTFNSENPLEHYTEFWSDALQRIDALQNLVYNQCNELEKKYQEFESVYQILSDLTIEIVSLYAGFNTLQGHEDLMRFKALIDRLQARYTRNGIDFDLLYHLLEKVSKNRIESFNNFPAIEHIDRVVNEEKSDSERKKNTINDISYLNRPFKWITFERNNSFFMASFETISQFENNDFKIDQPDEIGLCNAETEKISFTFKDLLVPQDFYIEPTFFLLINDSIYLPADRILKKIFSHYDMMTSKIENFESAHDEPYRGRIKIFGRNHLYLNLENSKIS